MGTDLTNAVISFKVAIPASGYIEITGCSHPVDGYIQSAIAPIKIPNNTRSILPELARSFSQIYLFMPNMHIRAEY